MTPEEINYYNLNQGIQSSERKKIIFSHHYPKLHGQTSGKLIGMEGGFVFKGQEEYKELLDYDTVFYNEDGSIGRYPIEENKEYFQLIFVGNKHIPFCTLRCLKNPLRYQYYHYSIGQMFDFEFLDDKT